MTALTTPDILADTVGSRSHSAKRMSVIDAAASVFCREGFGAANIDLVAAEAGVSRQTIYNHHGDKEKLFLAVVKEVAERMSAGSFAVIDTFPDKPTDLQGELTAFAIRVLTGCACSRDGKFITKLIQREGERYPELFAAWNENGPEKTNAALAARFARLALAGHLELDDPDLAARQFMALAKADLHTGMMLGRTPSEADIAAAAASAVKTFLRAYGKRA